VESEVVGSKPTRCMWNLLIKNWIQYLYYQRKYYHDSQKSSKYAKVENWIREYRVVILQKNLIPTTKKKNMQKLISLESPPRKQTCPFQHQIHTSIKHRKILGFKLRVQLTAQEIQYFLQLTWLFLKFPFSKNRRVTNVSFFRYYSCLDSIACQSKDRSCANPSNNTS